MIWFETAADCKEETAAGCPRGRVRLENDTPAIRSDFFVHQTLTVLNLFGTWPSNQRGAKRGECGQERGIVYPGQVDMRAPLGYSAEVLNYQ